MKQYSSDGIMQKEQECITKEKTNDREAREKRNSKWDGDIYRAIWDLQKSRVSAHDLCKEHHLSGAQTTRITVFGATWQDVAQEMEGN